MQLWNCTIYINANVIKICIHFMYSVSVCKLIYPWRNRFNWAYVNCTMHFCMDRAGPTFPDIFYSCGTFHCLICMTTAALNSLQRVDTASPARPCAHIGISWIAPTCFRCLKSCGRLHWNPTANAWQSSTRSGFGWFNAGGNGYLRNDDDDWRSCLNLMVC